MNTTKAIMYAVLFAASVTPALAQDVRITTFKSDSTFTLNGRTFTVSRNPDTTATLQADFARTSRACPPDCLQPQVIADGVATLGELEVLTFLEDRVTDGTGLLLDARMPEDFAANHIPGAVNVPVSTLGPENRFRTDILHALGAVSNADGTMNFTDAMALTFYSGGVWSNDAPAAINHLLSFGYPTDKLFYYRGGMQAWLHVGLTAITPQSPG